jgi:hypothetical protein
MRTLNPLPLGTTYYVPCVARRGLTMKLKWEGSEFDYMRLSRGVVHTTLVSAVKQAANMLSNTSL